MPTCTGLRWERLIRRTINSIYIFDSYTVVQLPPTTVIDTLKMYNNCPRPNVPVVPNRMYQLSSHALYIITIYNKTGEVSIKILIFAILHIKNSLNKKIV